MQQSRCVRFERVGPPERVLEVLELPLPVPGRGQVRVRMLAAPVNPSDRLFIEGRYGVEPQLPSGAGFEGAGVVESSGAGLLGRLLVGRRVCVLNRGGGTWATHTVVDARSVIPVPGDLTVEQVATFFVNPATALLLSRRILRPGPGEWLMQSAGASSVGRMVIALGRHFGFRTISLVRRFEQVEKLESLGADRVILWDGTSEPASLAGHVLQATGGESVRFAIDPVGGSTGTAMLQALGAGGRMIVYGTLSGEPLLLAPRDLMARQLTVSSFWLGPYMQRQSLVGKLTLVRGLWRLSRSGVLRVMPGPAFALDSVKEAVAAGDRHREGKTLLLLETPPG